MNDLIYRRDETLQKYRPLYYRHLQPGVDEQELLALEGELWIALLPAFKALYRWKNGQPPQKKSL